MQPDLRSLLVCPACHGDLGGWRRDVAAYELGCESCETRYPVRDGLPFLLSPHADTPRVHDELDHAHEHKRHQAAYFDRALAEEFEIERPHGTPDAYRWTLEDKFRRSLERLPDLRGSAVVDACCGSGMEAEMLARAGARVIAVDISEGCARRALERARRHGLNYLVVVGDVERLPLRDAGVDVGYVHDGLHHLPDPLVGVRELARVASRAVSLNEPADALATQVAVRLGLSMNYEGAGNRVARLRGSDVERELRSLGFAPLSSRYLAYYRHEPGRLMQAASTRAGGAAYRAGNRAANAVIGRWGNKLQVTALRRAA